jgi:predicted ATPase
LYRSGRQADALAAYRSFRDEIDRELGLEPSAELQRLETDILRHADTLQSPRDAVERRPARPTTPAPLPAPASGLIGRERDLDRVCDLLTEYRMVTLAGVGGVGKTHLAIAAAARLEPRHADGVVWCALDEVEQPSVAAAMATAVGARQRPELTVEASLLESLRSAAMLLVVDNCEHVLDVVAPLVGELVRACPRIRVLTTSRERLAVDGEHIWNVEPLAVPATTDDPAALTEVDSVRLLVDRARAVAPDFAVTADNARPVAGICTRLDGLPLAIELAGAQLRSMSAAEIAVRLDDRLRLLSADRRTAGGRHQTLQAVAAWSYDLLNDAERQVFDRVSVFAGGFGLEAVEAVAAGGDIDTAGVADVLAGLVDKSMVTLERTGPVTATACSSSSAGSVACGSNSGTTPRDTGAVMPAGSLASPSATRDFCTVRQRPMPSPAPTSSSPTFARRTAGCCRPATSTARCAFGRRSLRTPCSG